MEHLAGGPFGTARTPHRRYLRWVFRTGLPCSLPSRHRWSDLPREGAHLLPALYLIGPDVAISLLTVLTGSLAGAPLEPSARPPVEREPTQRPHVLDDTRDWGHSNQKSAADHIMRLGALRSVGAQDGLGLPPLAALIPGSSTVAVTAVAQWRAAPGPGLLAARTATSPVGRGEPRSLKRVRHSYPRPTSRPSHGETLPGRPTPESRAERIYVSSTGQHLSGIGQNIDRKSVV